MKSHYIRRLRPDDIRELGRSPGAPILAMLQETALLISAQRNDEGTIESYVRALLPSFELWTQHPKWKPSWSCRVSESRDTYAPGEKVDALPLHSDMSRFHEPPAIVMIYCVQSDPHSLCGGANIVMRADEILSRLAEDGHAALQQMLTTRRPLNCDDRCGMTASIMPRGDEPVRMFDISAATNGDHLALTELERRAYRQVQELCMSWTDLHGTVRLAPGELLVVSNRRWLHGRTCCAGPGRTTQILLADPTLAFD